MDRQRILPRKPYRLGGPKRRKEKKSNKSSPVQRNRVTLRIIGLDRMESVPQEQATVYFGDQPIERNLTFSQMRDRNIILLYCIIYTAICSDSLYNMNM